MVMRSKDRSAACIIGVASILTAVSALVAVAPGAQARSAGRTGHVWLTVTTGGWHTCGIRRDHTLWCWGFNGYGELGTGDIPVVRDAGVGSAPLAALLGYQVRMAV